LYCLIIILFAACTFDYGQAGDGVKETPDLVMENVEYVRVRSADPIARFRAERAERYEALGVMRLVNFVFEQYGERGEEINAFGGAGFASVVIESGDVSMDNGVWIEVDSEDIILETKQLDWKDEPRTLTTHPGNEVYIFQDSGTNFTGTGLRVDARNRTFEFTGKVFGTFIPTDDEDDEEGEESGEPRTRTPRTRTTGFETPIQRSQTTTPRTETTPRAETTTQRVGTTPRAETAPGTETTTPRVEPVPPRPTPPRTPPIPESTQTDEDEESTELSIEEAEQLKNIDPEDLPDGK
jgi:hypothetical protein